MQFSSQSGFELERSYAPRRQRSSEFIPLRGGREFIRTTEIVSVAWESRPGESMADPHEWRLKIFFQDCPSVVLYGDEATTVLSTLCLPIRPPTK